MSPSQLSLAVRSTGAGTSAAHWTITSAGADGATGAVSSFTFIVWLTLDSFPQPSTKVHVRTIVN